MMLNISEDVILRLKNFTKAVTQEEIEEQAEEMITVALDELEAEGQG